MKGKNLRLKTAFRAVMLVLMLCGVGVINIMAQKSTKAGTIYGKFTINSVGNQVYFSQGNLQYQASTNTWRFADNQWDYVGTLTNNLSGYYGGTVSGSDNTNISSTYDGWIDLFGWGTSGYNHGGNCYQPWSTSNNYSDYYAYGSNLNNLDDQTGQADWGYNPISNGGNQTNQWRTLTYPEWKYMLETRSTTSGIRYAKANVNSVNGIILLPDEWSSSTYDLSNTNNIYASYNSNTISASQWMILENAGAVFMPAGGWRNRTSVYNVGSEGSYWSASYCSISEAGFLYFSDGNLDPDNCYDRYGGFSVRLVRVAENYSYSINAIPSPEEGGMVNGNGTYEESVTCTLTAIANNGYSFVNWTKDNEEVSTDAQYSFTVTDNASYVANFSLAVNINFTDATVKAICIENWDTDGDGEISYEEAETVTDLGEIFKNNSSITSFDELQYFTGLTSIGNYAFYYCTSLSSVIVPNSVTTIGVNAFYRCSELSSITLGNSVTSIESGAFSGSGITGQLIIPNSVTSIGDDAFANCSGITGELIIPNSITDISDQAFAGCSGLTTLTIPNSVTSIGSMAFYGCEALTSIDFSNNITYIGSSAFSNTGWYNSQPNGILYLHNWCIGYKGDAPTGVLIINNSTVGIASRAFANCNNITGALNIPNTVITIGDDAFTWCNGLISLTIGTSVTSIGARAFYSCYNLTGSLVIPNSVTSIGSQSFDNCSRLTSLSIGPSVTNIGNSAFYKCTGVTTITSLAINPPTVGNNTFYNVDKSIPVYVTYGSLDTYTSAPYWSEFTNYQTTAYVTISGYGSSTESDKWAFIASPLADDVEPEDIDGLIATTSADFDLYQLNPAATNEWENWKQTGDHYHFNLVNGRGYLYANRNDVNIILQGDMFTDDYKDLALQTGWNLVGNPYAQSAYINRSYYKMNAAGDDVEAVSAYTTTAIPVCTGVVVQGASNADVVRFTTSKPSKSAGNGGLQMTLAKAGNRGNEMQDKAIVIFEENVQLGKYIFNENHAKLYIPQDGNDYAIAYSDGKSEIPLYFRTKEMGTYTINFNNDAELRNIYLVDKFEGAVIDLSVCSSYTFIGSSADRPDRFELVFGFPTESETDNFAYQSGNEIIVSGDGELQVFDVMGRMVAKQYVNGVEMIAKPSVNGVYIFRLNEKTQKIVVK